MKLKILKFSNNKKELTINYLANQVFYINRNKYLTFNAFKIINIALILLYI